MEKNFFCNYVEFPCHPLRGDTKIESFSNEINHIDLNLINIEYKIFLAKLKLKIYRVESFYKRPNTFGLIHTDINLDAVKINYVWSGADSSMCWYRVKDNIQSKPIKKSVINSKYSSYEPDEVDLIYSDPLKKTSLIQAGIPHNAITNTQDRYCLSIMIRKLDNSVLTMKEALSIFNNYLTI